MPPHSVIRESLGVPKIDFSKPPEIEPLHKSKTTSATTTESYVQISHKGNESVSPNQLTSNVDSPEHKGTDSSPPNKSVEQMDERKTPTPQARESTPKESGQTNQTENAKTEEIVEANDLNGDDMAEIEDDGDLLADDMDINAMTDEERAKMKKELGLDIDPMIVGMSISIGFCR